jgi:hypothetical protein
MNELTYKVVDPVTGIETLVTASPSAVKIEPSEGEPVSFNVDQKQLGDLGALFLALSGNATIEPYQDHKN